MPARGSGCGWDRSPSHCGGESTSPNFGALVEIEPLLAIYGTGAEASIYTDPNGTLVKCRQFGEVLAEQLVIRSRTQRSAGGRR